MPAIIYFGAQPTAKVQADRDLKSRGIDLIRSTVSKVVPAISMKYQQPGFELYKMYFAAHVHAAAAQAPVSTRQKKTWTIPSSYKALPKPLMTTPRLIFTPTRDSNDPAYIAGIKVDYEARETVDGKGKRAFETAGTIEMAKKISEAGLFNLVTATNSSTMNVAGFQVYLLLHRIVDAFLRVNQYSGRKSIRFESGHQIPEHRQMQEGAGEPAHTSKPFQGQDIPDAPKHFALVSEGEPTHVARNYVAFSNLPNKVSEYDYIVAHPSHLPADYSGLILAYEPKLSDKDYAIVPRVIADYFMDCLGDEMIDVHDTFEQVKSSWGNLARTVEGERLAHMFKCIDIAFRTQCHLRPIIVRGMYKGMVLLGGGYSIRLNGVDFFPVELEELRKALQVTNPHDASLLKIYQLLRFPDDVTRKNKMGAAQRLRDVNRDLLEYAFSENVRSEIKDAALNLTFPEDEAFLVTNAFNVARVLEAIADPTISETQFPMSPTVIDSPHRDMRLLSAFGNTSFSFLVPGGTKMELDGEFAVVTRKEGKVMSSNVTRVGAIFVKLEDAYRNLQTMKEGRYILNPYAGKSATYRSTGAYVSEYSHESKDRIVVALRKVVGVEGKDTTDQKKRKAEEAGGSDRKAKRAALDW